MNCKNILSSIAICIAIQAQAQNADVAILPKSKVNYIVGIQANQLIRQVFNFSNNNPLNNNPYLITITRLNPNTKKWGLDFGVGYEYGNTFTADGNSKINTNINSLNARIGLAKQVTLTTKFAALIAIHGLINKANNKTISEFVSFSSLQRTTTSDDITNIGLGPNLSINYNINSKIIIGTEANYYFKIGTTKNKSIFYSEFNGVPNSNNQPPIINKFDNKSFVLSLPAVIYIKIKL